MKKVLIVEDDPFLAQLYVDILKHANYEAQVAEDGESGRKKLKDGFDLLLLDIMLPKMNGLDLLEEIRNNPETKDLKVIIITNLASEEEQQRAEKLGISRYLIKTQYDPNQVIEIIKETVSN